MADNGTSTVAEGDLIVNIGDITAGGETGAAVLNDVTLTLERENTIHHGVGNDEPVDHSSGNKTYSFDTEAVVSESVYKQIKEMYDDDETASGAMVDDNDVVDTNIGVIVWNQVELAASDGEDVTVSLQADCYEVSL